MSNLIPSYKQGFARCAAESKYPELWRGLVGAWCPFLGPTGWDLCDWSGHHNDGALADPEMNPATAWVRDRRWALEFDGDNDYMDAGGDSSLDFGTGDFSIVLGLKSDTPTDNYNIAGNRQAAPYQGWFFQWNLTTGKLRFHTYSSAAKEVYTQNPVSRNEWHHIAAVRNGTALQIYVDGSLENQAIEAVQNVDSSANTYIAQDPFTLSVYGNDDHYDGIIDHAYIYNRAPSAEEVALLHREPYGMFEYRAPRSIFIMPGITSIMLQHNHFDGGAIL